MWKATLASIGIAVSLALSNLGAYVYPQTLLVVDVNEESWEVTAETATGIQYAFIAEDDWAVGDIASVIMCNMATMDVTDDIILGCPRYSSFTVLQKGVREQ